MFVNPFCKNSAAHSNPMRDVSSLSYSTMSFEGAFLNL
jgi:hypothetical protein